MLVNCAAYRDGKKVGDIEKHEIKQFISQPDCFVWVAMRDTTGDEIEEWRAEFGLHELAVEDAHHGHQRPKIEEYGDSLFVVLHTVEFDDASNTYQVGEVDVFVGRNYVMSVRNRTTKGFADVRMRCEREPELLRIGPGYVLYTLMDAVVDRYFPLLEQLETELENIEARIFSGNSERKNVEALYQLKSKAVTLKHSTGALLDATTKLFGGRVPPVVVGLGDYFRDVYDHLLRLNAHTDSVREMVTTATSVNLSLITLAESEVTKRLASYAALIGVPTLLAGIYGMNFEHMPELKWQWGYPVSLVSMVLVDVWLAWRFRKAGWL